MSETLVNLTDIPEKYSLNQTEAEYIRLKSMLHTNASIAKMLDVSEMTVYRMAKRDHVKLAMAEMMAITMSDNVLGLGEVMGKAIQLYHDTITSKTVPLDVRLQACDSVARVYNNLSANEREGRLFDLMMGQMQPIQAQPTAETASFDEMA